MEGRLGFQLFPRRILLFVENGRQLRHSFSGPQEIGFVFVRKLTLDAEAVDALEMEAANGHEDMAIFGGQRGDVHSKMAPARKRAMMMKRKR